MPDLNDFYAFKTTISGNSSGGRKNNNSTGGGNGGVYMRGCINKSVKVMPKTF